MVWRDEEMMGDVGHALPLMMREVWVLEVVEATEIVASDGGEGGGDAVWCTRTASRLVVCET